MDSLKQQALDYALGILPMEESLQFEVLIQKDETARRFLRDAQEDFANLSFSAPPSKIGDEVRQRVLDCCRPKLDLNPLLESEEIQRLRDNFNISETRYSGGDAMVEIGDLQNSLLQDNLQRNYQILIDLLSLVAGDSNAALGDLSDLQKFLRANKSFSDDITTTLNQSLQVESPSSHSILRTALTSLPSLSFFADRLKSENQLAGDVRRLFYLCRDQLKIMRASFSDLDPQRLKDDEILRLHGAGLLRTKWWGAEHAYFSSPGSVKCGHFFDGPITERCVEFAEYDSNMYSLANLHATRASNGEFHLELLKDAIPGCTLAVASSKMSQDSFDSLQYLAENQNHNASPSADHHLWNLLKDSMVRSHPSIPFNTLSEMMVYGNKKIGEYTYTWFAWSAIPNAQTGASASTLNPLQ